MRDSSPEFGELSAGSSRRVGSPAAGGAITRYLTYRAGHTYHWMRPALANAVSSRAAVSRAEARRAVGQLGAVAITLRPNPTSGRTLDDPSYDSFYAAVQELNVPLCIHESTGCHETAAGDRYGGMMDPASYAFNHVISHPFEQMFAMMSLICGGVLERSGSAWACWRRVLSARPRRAVSYTHLRAHETLR